MNGELVVQLIMNGQYFPGMDIRILLSLNELADNILLVIIDRYFCP
jgi:hypothetical protein